MLFAVKTDCREKCFCPCLPLEGKVPAKPADEVGSSPSDMHNVKQSAGAKQIIAIFTGRDSAKTICANLNPNWPCAEHDLMWILQKCSF